MRAMLTVYRERRGQAGAQMHDSAILQHIAGACRRRLAIGMAPAVLSLSLLTLPAAPGATPALQASSGQAVATATTHRDAAGAVTVNVTPAQAARAARHEYGGKILGVQLEADDGPPYYRVRLLRGGKVHVVIVSAHQ